MNACTFPYWLVTLEAAAAPLSFSVTLTQFRLSESLIFLVVAVKYCEVGHVCDQSQKKSNKFANFLTKDKFNQGIYTQKSITLNYMQLKVSCPLKCFSFTLVGR